MRNVHLLIVVGVLTLGSMCVADDETTPASTSSPEQLTPEHGKINTPDASPVDPGHFEVETGFLFSQAKHFWDSDGDIHKRGFASEHALGVSTTVGIRENLDFNVSTCYRWLKDKENDFDDTDGELGPENGHHFGDLSFGARYRFIADKQHNLDVAYIGGFTAPTGSGESRREIGTSQGYWSLNQTLAASKDWGCWTANADIGFSLPFGPKREDERGTLNADLAVGYQLLSWLQPELELNYCHDIVAHETDTDCVAATAGLVMPIGERLRVNMGVQQDLWGRGSDKTTSFLLAVKVTF